MASPISQLPATGFPASAPATRRQILAVRQRSRQGAVPQVPAQIVGNGLGFCVWAPWISEVIAARYAACPNPGFNGPAELVLPQNLHRLHTALITGALIAHLCDQARSRLEAVANCFKFGKLMHQRLLAVNVFVVL